MSPTAPSTVEPTSGSLVRPILVYVGLYGAIGAYFPYFSVFFRSVGLDLGTVGLIMALHATVSLVAAPSWGSLADRARDVRGPLLAAGLWAAAAGTWVAIGREPVGLAIGVAFLAAGTAGMGPLLDTRTVQIAGADRDRFGRARAWGSIAFVVSAVVTGAIVDRTSPVGMFLVYVPLLAAAGVLAFLLLGRPDAGPAARRGGRFRSFVGLDALGAILGHPVLGLFFVGAVLVWMTVSAVTTFISIQVIELGGDGQVVGLLWAIGAVIEVPLMFLFPRLSRRIGAERLLVLGALAFAGRSVGFALAPVPAVLLVASPLGGIGFALFYVGTVSYVSRVVPSGVQATAQGIFSGTAFSLWSILGSVVGGQVAGALSLAGMFLAAGIGTVLAAGVVWWAVVAGGRAAPRGAVPG